MTAIEKKVAVRRGQGSVRNGKLTGKAQLLADTITGIEAYARRSPLPAKSVARLLACELANWYKSFDVQFR
jgi:hypothetical protein